MAAAATAVSIVETVVGAQDPTNQLIEDIAAKAEGLQRVKPLALLAELSAAGEIPPERRDAGEILHRLGVLANSGKPGSAKVTYKWRDKDGQWSLITTTRSKVSAIFESALRDIRSEHRRRVLTLALVAREPGFDYADVTSLRMALGDVAGHFWGPVRMTTFVTNSGVTLRAVAANDNTPTPERLDKEGDVRRTEDGAVRIIDGFERMHARGQLDDDDFMNDNLHAAGLRYQSEHHCAGLNPLGAIDYERPMVDGGGAQVVSERMLAMRDSFRAARRALGDKYGPIVDAVVLEGKTLVEAGRLFGYHSKDSAAASAKERLNTALRLLAQQYGIIRKIS